MVFLCTVTIWHLKTMQRTNGQSVRRNLGFSSQFVNAKLTFFLDMATFLAKKLLLSR